MDTNQIIAKALSILSNAESSRIIINRYARNLYEEKFKLERKTTYGFHYYTGFDVISKNELRINFCYGSGDMEFNDNFLVKI